MQARLEALLEAAGISKLAENKQLADPDVLKRLTSSVSSALDEAAAALTRMRTEPSGGLAAAAGTTAAAATATVEGTSLVAACTQVQAVHCIGVNLFVENYVNPFLVCVSFD